MMPFWPVEYADPVVDPERPAWDTWGAEEQERILKKRIGPRLFEYLESATEDGGQATDD